MPGFRSRFRRRADSVAFVLGSGGNLGAIQVGMLRALAEQRIRPDVVLGCSVGALNGAMFAAQPDLVGVAQLEELWRSLDGKDLLPAGFLPYAVQMARKGESIHSIEPLRALVDGALPARTFEELAVPFECVATDIDGAREVWFSSGDLAPAVLASAAIPSVYPSVVIDEVRYLDGAIVNDVPLSRAVELGATTIFVLHVGAFDRPRPVPKRPFDVALQAYWVARRHRFMRDLASVPADVEVVVLPAGTPPAITLADFSHTETLRSTAYDLAKTALVARGAARPTRPARGAKRSRPAKPQRLATPERPVPPQPPRPPNPAPKPERSTKPDRPGRADRPDEPGEPGAPTPPPGPGRGPVGP